MTLSSTKPTKSGYTFVGWGTSTTDTAKDYDPGDEYTSNAKLTLYAIWKKTIQLSYNVNGGSGSISAQTATVYNATTNYAFTISSTIPKRTNYNFLGWATSASATTATYTPGSKYTISGNATLYAVWELAYTKPRITKVSVSRCAEYDGGYDDVNGKWAYVLAYFECDRTVVSREIAWQAASESTVHREQTQYSNQITKGWIETWVGDGELSTDKTYTFTITVTDELGYNTEIVTLPGAKFVIDILAEGKGIAFNKPAEIEGVMDIGFQTRLLGGIAYVLLPAETDLDECHTPGFYMGENVSTYHYVNCPLTSGTFTLEILAMGDNGQLMQRLTQCHISAPIVFERTYYKSAGWGEWFGGWIYPSLSEEFTMYGSDTTNNAVRYRKDGRTVEIRGAVTPTTAITGSDAYHTIFSLPVGYRPSSMIYLLCQGSGTAVWMLRINPNGDVSFARYRRGDAWDTADVNDTNTGAWLPFQATYLV